MPRGVELLLLRGVSVSLSDVGPLGGLRCLLSSRVVGMLLWARFLELRATTLVSAELHV